MAASTMATPNDMHRLKEMEAYDLECARLRVALVSALGELESVHFLTVLIEIVFEYSKPQPPAAKCAYREVPNPPAPRGGWYSYLDIVMKDDILAAAAFYGHDGSMWVGSHEILDNPRFEAKACVEAVRDPRVAAVGGWPVSGLSEWIYLRHTEPHVMIGRKGPYTMLVGAGTRVLIVAVTKESANPGNANSFYFILNDLKQKGF